MKRKNLFGKEEQKDVLCRLRGGDERPQKEADITPTGYIYSPGECEAEDVVEDSDE